ncbi:MAG TPA: hypothetical protein VF701_05065 [Thermoanaerobaculia bacterium]
MTRTFGHEESALKEERYLRRYEEMFASLADQPIALLELGVHRGGSMLLWRDYFPRGTIAGLDLLPVELKDDSGRIHIYQGSQTDPVMLDRIGAECAPDGFDIIVDDCSHIAELSRTSFTHLFDNHLKKGGWYVIEDWGTGYWPHWHDGAEYDGTNHIAGMAGFIKELVDVAALGEWVDQSSKALPGRPGLCVRSTIERMTVFWSQVFLRKGL